MQGESRLRGSRSPTKDRPPSRSANRGVLPPELRDVLDPLEFLILVDVEPVIVDGHPLLGALVEVAPLAKDLVLRDVRL